MDTNKQNLPQWFYGRGGETEVSEWSHESHAEKWQLIREDLMGGPVETTAVNNDWHNASIPAMTCFFGHLRRTPPPITCTIANGMGVVGGSPATGGQMELIVFSCFYGQTYILLEHYNICYFSLHFFFNETIMISDGLRQIFWPIPDFIGSLFS